LRLAKPPTRTGSAGYRRSGYDAAPLRPVQAEQATSFTFLFLGRKRKLIKRERTRKLDKRKATEEKELKRSGESHGGEKGGNFRSTSARVPTVRRIN